MNNQITEHYSFGGLRERIEHGISQLGEPASVNNLGAVDEFHVGGRSATEHLIGQMKLGEADRVLDLGSGLGGTARYIASATGASVTGVDLTREYVEVATWLTDLVGLAGRVDFVHASIADKAPAAEPFTAATMVHVGMNIPDKSTVFSDVGARLQPGAVFAIYDLMCTGDEQPDYPVPWAATEATSALETVEAYQEQLLESGFSIEVVDDRTEAAIETFSQIAASTGDGPPALGLHLVMGPTTGTKLGNLATAVRDGILAPPEIIARRV